jgi:hypothetical protein
MKNINTDSLVDFMLAGSEKELDPSVTKWIKGKVASFRSGTICNHCQGRKVTPIISPRVVLRCAECGEYTEIVIDNVPFILYNDTIILKKDTLIKILEAGDIK